MNGLNHIANFNFGDRHPEAEASADSHSKRNANLNMLQRLPKVTHLPSKSR